MKNNIVTFMIVMITMAMFTGSVRADSTANANADVTTSANNGGFNGTIENNFTIEAEEADTRGIDSPIQSRTQSDVRYSGEYSVKNVPDVSAPGLTTTLTETCMGSTSAGGAVVGFGFSFGTTWRDSACVRRLDARQLQGLGYTLSAKELMCDSKAVREALLRAGKPCFADLPEDVRGELNPAANVQVIEDEWQEWSRSDQGAEYNNEQSGGGRK